MAGGERHLGSRSAKILNGDGDHRSAADGGTNVSRIDMEVRQPAIAVYPIIKKPLQAAFGLSFDEALHVRGIFILVRTVSRERLFQSGLSDHVAQHPPDVHRFATL